MKFFYYFLLILTISFAEKSSKEIQRDIDLRKNEISSLKKEIKDVERGIIKKTQEAISTTEILLDLEGKISLTEKLIRSLAREERYIESMIYDTQERIKRKKAYLVGLEEKLKLRLQYIYKNGNQTFLKTIFAANNWNEAIYKIKYLEILKTHEIELRGQLRSGLNELDFEQKKLDEELNKIRKIQSDKETENKRLEIDQKRRKKYLGKINNQKINLENNLKQKQMMIAKVNSIINQLYDDKESMQKRERELNRIRSLQNKSTSDNFAKMKGKLPWPTKGKITSKFGNKKNYKLNTITENVGIEIKAKAGSPVNSVLDGVVSTITFIRGYGSIIIVDHGGGFNTVYAKIEGIKVSENEYIQSGEQLAVVASTGNTNNDMLHFEVWGNNQKLNPEHWLIKK